MAAGGVFTVREDERLGYDCAATIGAHAIHSSSCNAMALFRIEGQYDFTSPRMLTVESMEQEGFGTSGVPTRSLPLIEKLSLAIAFFGGVVLLACAGIVIVSIAGRAMFDAPIPGDYEFVRVGLAVSIFSFLPYTQIRYEHVAVDTFTLWLPGPVNRVIDGTWDILLAVIFALFAVGLGIGMLEVRRFGETLTEFDWPIWPIYGICSALCGFCAIASAASAFARNRAA
ncbi:MAG: TRAP transporter small permease [Pseudorhodoplanes sp.]|uniref:TRAP transporter small permease n=1 Tax=Pseudorhodoplanes sp. TaxID=1934341 RepID=UPI003D0F8B0B